jgi:rhamnopyranosyl-N-acetylglucosaminyl-diphospho-decaprenol beta-1,3/1,4-galactofuranosyltransferase
MLQSVLETSETKSPSSPRVDQVPSVPRIAAVVVTRNRLKLLQRLLAALSRQTRALDAIIVVDVNSDDGTTEFLKSAAKPIVPVFLDHNAGGAGGFNAGMQRAVADGFDWLWAMDDDGYPSDDALKRITDRLDQTDAKWLNSMVVEVEQPSRLVWMLPHEGGYNDDLATMQARGTIIPGSAPFNGTLIHRCVIEAIGLPCKDLFLWGDEMEFKRRAEGRGFKTVSVTDSIFHHPAPPRGSVTTLPLKAFRKYYYRVRNYEATVNPDGTVQFNYQAARMEGRNYIRTLLKDSVKVPFQNFIKITIVLRAIWAARRNNAKRFKL